MKAQGHYRKVAPFAIAVALSAVAVSGCGPLVSATVGGAPQNTAETHLTVVGENPNTRQVGVTDPVTVTTSTGVLTRMTVTGPDNEQLVGSIAENGGSWVSPPDTILPFGADYTVKATVVTGEGDTREVETSFATVAPAETPEPSTRYTADGKTYGIGMPLTVAFHTPVDNKGEVESRLRLTTSKPVEGAWSWNDDSTEVTFRPKDFWPANTHVVLNSQLYGVRLNNDAAAGSNLSVDYNIGDSLVMEVDQPSLAMTVKRNGQVEKTIPVTIGKPGYETLEGIKVISTKEGTITMKSPPGDPEYYVADNVEYSMRLTDHGEYIHAAPWASSAFGNYPYSHGCISMSTADAAALFAEVNPGDLVWVNGKTGQPWRKDNGITLWNEPWNDWVAKSATGIHTYSANT